MWHYHPELLAVPVPRYTSFPTAAEFAGDVGPADYAEAVASAAGDISVYVHIPFCEKICWYCGCNTAAANRTQRLTSYLEALQQEIDLVAGLLPATARVTRIAFGGGSPNALAPDDFLRMFDGLAGKLPADSPLVSIELDPRTLSGDWRDVVRWIGATHASLGVQTFAPALQSAIGRVQPLCMIDRSVRLLRDAGITSLNFDLMYGLPGQSMGDLAETLDLAAAYHADRIALFGYAHVPHMIPRQRRIDATALPTQDERFAMAMAGHEQLVNAGYFAAGFDHFAMPGDPLAQAALTGRLRRNFQGFTDDNAETVIGLGASAISSFPSLLAQNEKNSGRYRMRLSQGQLATTLGKKGSAEDQRIGRIIESLLCSGRAQIDRNTLEPALERLAPYLDAGLALFDYGELVIPANALPYARSIAAAFDPYRQHTPRRFSSAV